VVGAFDRAAATYDQVGVEFFQPISRIRRVRSDLVWSGEAGSLTCRCR
jgi:hypothetical protein